MSPYSYTEDTLVQQTTADYQEQQLGWTLVYAYNNKEGGRTVNHQVEYFNLDAIISVGYPYPDPLPSDATVVCPGSFSLVGPCLRQKWSMGTTNSIK